MTHFDLAPTAPTQSGILRVSPSDRQLIKALDESARLGIDIFDPLAELDSVDFFPMFTSARGAE